MPLVSRCTLMPSAARFSDEGDDAFGLQKRLAPCEAQTRKVRPVEDLRRLHTHAGPGRPAPRRVAPADAVESEVRRVAAGQSHEGHGDAGPEALSLKRVEDLYHLETSHQLPQPPCAAATRRPAPPPYRRGSPGARCAPPRRPPSRPSLPRTSSAPRPGGPSPPAGRPREDIRRSNPPPPRLWGRSRKDRSSSWWSRRSTTSSFTRARRSAKSITMPAAGPDVCGVPATVTSRPYVWPCSRKHLPS